MSDISMGFVRLAPLGTTLCFTASSCAKQRFSISSQDSNIFCLEISRARPKSCSSIISCRWPLLAVMGSVPRSISWLWFSKALVWLLPSTSVSSLLFRRLCRISFPLAVRGSSCLSTWTFLHHFLWFVQRESLLVVASDWLILQIRFDVPRIALSTSRIRLSARPSLNGADFGFEAHREIEFGDEDCSGELGSGFDARWCLRHGMLSAIGEDGQASLLGEARFDTW